MRQLILFGLFLTLPMATTTSKTAKVSSWKNESTSHSAVIKNAYFALRKLNDDRTDTYLKLLSVKKASSRQHLLKQSKDEKDYQIRLRIRRTNCSKSKKLSLVQSQRCEVDATKVRLLIMYL